MTRRVRILRRAQDDLMAIRHELEPDAARRVLEILLGAMEKLASFDRLGPLPRDRRLRTLGYRYLSRERFLIFYKIAGNDVRVYRVLADRRAYWRVLR